MFGFFFSLSFFFSSFFWAAVPPFWVLPFVLLPLHSTTGQSWGRCWELLRLLCQIPSVWSPLAHWDLLSMSCHLRWGLTEPVLSADNPEWQTHLAPLWGQDLPRRGTATRFCSGWGHGYNNTGLKFYISLLWKPFLLLNKTPFVATDSQTSQVGYIWDKAAVRRQE